MKKLLPAFVFLFSFQIVLAQNLVPNPSFEDTIGCPSIPGDINKSSGWQTFCLSPDYFNPCNQFTFGVPNNFGGYQQAASGSAYSGFLSYINSIPNGREFVAHNLTSQLNVGTKYFVSFKVVLSLGSLTPSNCASDKIGAMFSMAPYTCQSLITNSPPVFTNSIVTDSLNWTRISGSFIADSAYSNLVIGNFFDDANTDTLRFFNDFSDNAYYFLDDVCVSTDSIYANNYNYTGISENHSMDNINCYPNPVLDNLTVKNLFRKKIDVEIYDVFGERLYFAQNVSEQSISINLSSVNSGILLIKIKSGQQINTYKLLKQ